MRRPKTLEGALQALEDLRTEQERLSQGVKEELLANIHNDITALRRLGFFYSLVPIAKKDKANGGVRASLRHAATMSRADGKVIGEITDGPCKVCGFKTSPLHDGRMHLHHQKKKGKKYRPFSDAELAKLELTRVE